MVFIVVALFVVVVTLLLLKTVAPKNFPPGPTRLPLLGNLPTLKRLSRRLGGQHLALCELARLHRTNVLGLRLGGDDVVAVFSYPVVRAVLTGDEYDGRPDNFFLRLRCMGTKNGITCVDGERWQVQRNFVVRHLRNLGFGRGPMECMVGEEAEQVLARLEGDPELRRRLDPASVLAPAVLNILWQWTTGSRFSNGDPRLEGLLRLLRARARAFDMSGGLLAQMPWLRHVAPRRCGYELVCRMNEGLRGLLEAEVARHKDEWTEGREDDLIHAFVTEMRKPGAHDSFTDAQLMMVCIDMFIAGGHTTSNTLDFAFLAMILYPDIQAKIQAHLDSAFELGKPIEYADRQKVPYIEAVIMEVERHYNITPVTGPRRVLKDTVLEGYSIPKNTTVLISTYSVLNDKEYWKDPEVFRPERFLTQDGKLFIHDRLIPFGLGHRRCPGETLAKSCIFTFFCEIMRRYNISVAEGSSTPTGIPVPGITLTPEPYKAHLTKRTSDCDRNESPSN